MMINLARYVQCHPRFRYFSIRHKRTVLIVFLLFSIFFLVFEHISNSKSTYRSSTGSYSEKYQDELLALQSQIGYLRKKLAQQGISVDLNEPELPIIYVITPTYARPVQKAELTRLCHTFLLVPNLHWILVEDAKIKTDLLGHFLKDCGVSYTHLNALTPSAAKSKSNQLYFKKLKGVFQRNKGIEYLRKKYSFSKADSRTKPDGVVYFGDDDNTYTLELFSIMRNTKRVSVWPVGLVGGLLVEKPRVLNERVVGWDAVWAPERRFALDMAGFAVNLNHLLQHPEAMFSYSVKRGHLESEFLSLLIKDLKELEPKSPRKVLVWHTRSQLPKLDQESKLRVNLLPPSDSNMVY